jgi:lactoylglutathione lyase
MTDSVRIDHTGLSVADLEAMATWYADVFGFTRELTLRVEPLALDIVMLILPGCDHRLELLYRPGSGRRTDPRDPGEAALHQGFGHIAFDVDGVDAAYDRAVAAGARPVMAPRPSPEPGVRMAFVADPEGNLVELLDRRYAG